MTSKTTAPWGAQHKKTGLWWPGGSELNPEAFTETAVAIGATKAEARKAAADANGGKFPTAWLTIAQIEVSTEVAPITDTTPVAEEMSPEELDHHIRTKAAVIEVTFTGLVELLEEAQTRSIHTELGFASWTMYVADVVSKEMPTLGKQPALRQEVTRLMLESGMSQGAIADAEGVDQATVSRDAAKIKKEQVMQPCMTGSDTLDVESVEYPWVLQNDDSGDFWGGDYRDDWGVGDPACYSSDKQVKLAWTKVTGVQRIPKGHCVVQLTEDDLHGEPMPKVRPDIAPTLTVVGKDGKTQTRVVTPTPVKPTPEPARKLSPDEVLLKRSTEVAAAGAAYAHGIEALTGLLTGRAEPLPTVVRQMLKDIHLTDKVVFDAVEKLVAKLGNYDPAEWETLGIEAGAR